MKFKRGNSYLRRQSLWLGFLWQRTPFKLGDMGVKIIWDYLSHGASVKPGFYKGPSRGSLLKKKRVFRGPRGNPPQGGGYFCNGAQIPKGVFPQGATIFLRRGEAPIKRPLSKESCPIVVVHTKGVFFKGGGGVLPPLRRKKRGHTPVGWERPSFHEEREII